MSLVVLGVCFSLVLKMRFPPSVVESQHGWRTAMHLQGRNEVENRNGALRNGGCVAGLLCEDESEGRGENKERVCEF